MCEAGRQLAIALLCGPEQSGGDRSAARTKATAVWAKLGKHSNCLGAPFDWKRHKLNLSLSLSLSLAYDISTDYITINPLIRIFIIIPY